MKNSRPAAIFWQKYYSRLRFKANFDLGSFAMRHFLDLLDLSGDEILGLLREAGRLKAADRLGERAPRLMGRVLGLIFEKPSLRTRVSFQTAMAQLGGVSVFQGGKDVGLGSRESV